MFEGKNFSKGCAFKNEKCFMSAFHAFLNDNNY